MPRCSSITTWRSSLVALIALLALAGCSPGSPKFRGSDIKSEPGQTPGDYALDHSSQSYVFDTRGRLRLLERASDIVAALPHDIRALLKENG
ncbi:MAG TPA: hypothetical protein VNE59_12855 [Burkholderiales bacterium]|nr:hypothetical protein [Burkholderiales bacterium]